MTGREVLHTSLRVPSVALTTFDGNITERVWPYGKHLFMQFGDRILHTHLKMEGTWAIHRVGDRWRKPGHTARVVLHLADTHPIEIVGHSLGFVRVFGVDDYHEQIAHLGPDVLGEWDPGEAQRRIEAEPQASIGEALLEQRNLAGVGNEYRAEICYLPASTPRAPWGRSTSGRSFTSPAASCGPTATPPSASPPAYAAPGRPPTSSAATAAPAAAAAR